MTVITTKTVREIRRHLAEGQSHRKTAALVGVSRYTVERYKNDESLARNTEKAKARHLQQKADPERLEKKRRHAREWWRANRRKT